MSPPEPTEAQIEALREAIDYLERLGCDEETILLPELKRRAAEGDRHAAYLAEIVGELSHLRIPAT